MDCPLCKDTCLGQLQLVRRADVLFDLTSKGHIYESEGFSLKSNVSILPLSEGGRLELVCTGCGATSENQAKIKFILGQVICRNKLGGK